ncbi:hypothetical protein NKI12_24675 [Mesorhizobium australicum]|uniref:Uncharacterized protein n=1 Tax=Mesorhizobium australicum TaxID=536018 RepID=A0ACC6T536_9HYPH|nr:hypothetical protein [Mesorhizobium sp. LNHC209A00]
MPTTSEIREQYVEELRSILPTVEAWWDGVQAELTPEIAWKRWPTGPGAHPRVLAVFRKYYLRIEAANDEVLENPSEQEASERWGVDDHGEEEDIQSPADWLLFDIAAVAPDLKELTDGICFIPVGLNDEEEVV